MNGNILSHQIWSIMFLHCALHSAASLRVFVVDVGSIPPLLRLLPPAPPGDPAAVKPSLDRVKCRTNVQNRKAVVFGHFAAVVVIDDVADLRGKEYSCLV